MLVVEGNGALDGGIAHDVAVREVLGNDARAGLLLLCNLVRVAVLVGGDGGLIIWGGTRG